ncbi:uncharacterized protein LOC132054172 [Lycium ferocissimum]|uniref:uncharacterized protein LOC132054172 n=1 Tax=Lycium ferocissimum TaxID=112874 RepID=UPI002814FBFA|nr:uncharacterized protein LOC132054172 [Lycium ferocissimum]
MVELGFPYKFIQWVIECITSVSYSLVLNGGLTEPFQGKRGIRQGARNWEYYTYILLMFCKAEIQSIKLLQKAFLKFSAASRLQANIDKSPIYMTGVKEPFKQQLLQTLGFCEGSLPFKYLGVPLSSKKLTIAQCLPFVGKITEKMKCWYARLLSYASRLQLIKSVIFGVQIYWAQIFILPKRIMKMIDSICRSFLWTGSTEISKKALVSWAKICLPKAAGGHNVLDLCLWNKAAILKHLWALAKKKDCLWIRWVHSYYIKQDYLCPIPANATWVVRKILEVRKYVLQSQTLQGDLHTRLSTVVAGSKFSIQQMYVALLPQYQKVP